MSLHAGDMPGYKHNKNHNGTITCILGISTPTACAEVGIIANLAEGG